MKIDWESPKEEVRGPTRKPEGCLARPPPGRARHPPGCLVAPLGAPFRLYNTPGVETLKGESFRRSSATTERKPTQEKSHLRRQIPPGRSPPERGDHRHRHHHRHGHHRDHH